MIRKLYRKARAARWLKKIQQALEDPDLVPGRNPDHEGYANFLFYASFGDKWCILSFVPELLKRHANARLLAEEKDRELLRIFLGPALVITRVKFVSPARLLRLVKLVGTDSIDVQPVKVPRRLTLDLTYAVLKTGFPINRIRPFHIVQYPYFSDLILHHCVTYGTLLRTMLYLPPEVVACQPTHYTSEDHAQVEALFLTSDAGRAARPAVLIHVVNFSHESLSHEQFAAMIDVLLGQGFSVFLNITLHPAPEPFREMARLRPEVYPIEIPGHLLALACGRARLVIGVVGGAINVALQYSKTHLLVLFTPGKGLTPDFHTRTRPVIEAGRFLTSMYADWPCEQPGRVIKEVYMENPLIFSTGELCRILSNFLVANAATIGCGQTLAGERADQPCQPQAVFHA